MHGVFDISFPHLMICVIQTFCFCFSNAVVSCNSDHDRNVRHIMHCFVLSVLTKAKTYLLCMLRNVFNVTSVLGFYDILFVFSFCFIITFECALSVFNTCRRLAKLKIDNII